MRKFRCVIMRGGTSKAVFFRPDDMPRHRDHWNSFLLDIMGSPDVNQIDGIGGANSLTSKVAIVSPSTREDADVDYLFAQVNLTAATVAWNSNCGNISSAVGPYAVDERLVIPEGQVARVRIYNVNTGKIIVSEFKVEEQKANDNGSVEIPGVPGKGAPIWLSFHQPQGSMFKTILPTGNACDQISTSRGPIEISIVDAAAPLVYVKAEDVGLKGSELPADFSDVQLTFLEEIRSRAAELCGICSADRATAISPAVPKLTILSPPVDYFTITGTPIPNSAMDLSVRMLSMQKPHRAIAITGAVCIGAASTVEGSLVRQLCPQIGNRLRVGHAGGVAEIEVSAKQGKLGYVKVLRTARRIMEGMIYTKNDYES